jgi:hypothetical protein
VAASLAPDFIDADAVKAGRHFAPDGISDAQTITSYYIQQARAKGLNLVEASETGFANKHGEISAIYYTIVDN